jgi:Domain of unknown function (DUF4384)
MIIQEGERNSHLGELALRRFRVGEALGNSAHADACADCRARLKTLDDEQRRFEQEFSFDRFAAGVERASRSRQAPRRTRTWWPSLRVLAIPTLSLAAGMVLFVTMTGDRISPNRIKGGADITVRVAAGDGPQRTAASDVPEALALGERVRIGYRPGAHRYLLSLSVDERGQVTPLYPETGRSVSVGKGVGAGPRYLPDSIEFTDAGTERLIVIMSDEPLDVEAARRAARASFDRAKGDILHMPALELPGEQFQRTFIKP